MDPAEYKEITSGPDMLGRPVVEATIRRLSDHPDLVERRTRLLASRPIARPAGHTAGSHSDHLVVDLSIDELDQVVAALGDNEASAAMSDARRSELSYAATLLGTWNAIVLFRRAVS